MCLYLFVSHPHSLNYYFCMSVRLSVCLFLNNQVKCSTMCALEYWFMDQMDFGKLRAKSLCSSVKFVLCEDRN